MTRMCRLVKAAGMGWLHACMCCRQTAHMLAPPSNCIQAGKHATSSAPSQLSTPAPHLEQVPCLHKLLQVHTQPGEEHCSQVASPAGSKASRTRMCRCQEGKGPRR